MHYFSYGSNMSIRRLQVRVPSARKVGIGILKGHVLEFHKVSQDTSAKCDASETGDPEHRVHGVVFHISEHEKFQLDKAEGLGFGYAQKVVSVEFDDGSMIEAFTYYATHIDPTLEPFSWYLEHVLRGARENDLPESYIRKIEAIVPVEDTNRERHKRELLIYQSD